MERTRNTMIKTYNDTTKEVDAKQQVKKFTKKFNFFPKMSDVTFRPSLRTVDLG